MTHENRFIPYGKQDIDESDITAIADVLRSDYLTTGPKIEEFEKEVANYVRVKHSVAVSNGTAALHCAMYALGIEPGDEVIVSPITFAATTNCIIYQGGIPVFADVDADTLLIDPDQVKRKITSKTKAVIGVDYAGQPCDWDQLREIASQYQLALVADACHALGAEYKKKKVGTLADLTVFSFHPVKHITTGEGGLITTDRKELAQKMRHFRNHGITTDSKQKQEKGSWYYEMEDLGFNYRLTDIQCALGISQMKRFPEFLSRRRQIAAIYDEAFKAHTLINPLTKRADSNHAYHLYVVKIDFGESLMDKADLFAKLKSKGIAVNVHYIPVYLHPYYKNTFKLSENLCPEAENGYRQIISLPIYSKMSNEDVEYVIEWLKKFCTSE